MKYNSKTQAFILFSLSILGAALLLSYKKEGKETAEEEVEQTTLQRSEANHKRLKTVVDSTYSDWHVIVQETDIKTKHSRVGSKLLVTISKSGKTLFNKEVITPSILAKSLDNHFQLTSVYLKGITNTTVYISLEAFSRETDGELLHSRILVRPEKRKVQSSKTKSTELTSQNNKTKSTKEGRKISTPPFLHHIEDTIDMIN